MRRTLVFDMLALVSLPLIAGCNSDKSHVQGAVTMNGQPAEEGYITFRCIDQDKPAFTLNVGIEDGQYSSKSTGSPLPFGNYEVRVAVTKKTGRQIPLPLSPEPKMQDELIVVSAAEYSSPKSPLKYQHQEAGTFDIDVPAKK